MTNIASTFASKALVAVVAAAMIFSAFVAPAKAATAEELQTMINDLMAQMAALGGTTTGGSSASVCPFTWTRDLKTGATGADVKALQQFLNANADTRVSATGAGSAGMETEYFGPATAAAVSKFQVMHRADILTPAGLTNPTGFFGPSTRAKANALCVAGGGSTGGDDDDDDDTDTPGDLSGEASLNTLEVADGDDSDDVEEGSEDASVAEVTVEFEDGDASISRLDIALEVDGGNDGDDDPWKVFDTITLWVDGDEVASVDASDKDNYLDEDDGSIRFSGLDIVAMEDEEVVITVGATVNSSVDGSADGEGWNIAVGAIRFFDADGVATTEDTAGDFDLEDITDTTLSGNLAEFTIEEAGAGDDLDLQSSDADPDATTIALDEDDNVEAMIFAFELSAEDSDGDVVVNEVIVHATSTVASNMDDLVNDFRLEIGDDSFDAESYTGTGSTVTLVFDVDGEYTISADEVATAQLYADFEDMEAGDEGSTIVSRVYAAEVDAEGDGSGEEITVDGSSVTSETHTLRTEGLDLGEVTDGDDASDSTVVDSDTATDTYGVMFLEYEVTAFGDDLYVKANNAVRGASSTAGLAFTIEGTDGSATTTGSANVTYDIEGADENNGYFRLDDGETYTMVVTVDSYNPVLGGTYNLQLLSIGFASSEATANNSESATPANDYDSDSVFIES